MGFIHKCHNDKVQNLPYYSQGAYEKPYNLVREGVKKNINYLGGIFPGRGGGGTPHPSK